MLVSRTMARQWLDSMIEGNRKPSKHVVAQYAKDMNRNKWLITGDTVKFNTAGQLFDGQQRLMALLESNQRSVPFMVAYNVVPEAVIVTDAGRKRTVADGLRMQGSPNANLLSAIVRRFILWDAGVLTGSGGHGSAPTHQEVMERYASEVGPFDTAAARGRDAQQMRLGAGAQAGFAFYLFSLIDKSKSHTFFDMVLSGANLPELHPALALRNRLARREDQRHAQSALWIRGWNAYQEDRSRRRRRERRLGWVRECVAVPRRTLAVAA